MAIVGCSFFILLLVTWPLVCWASDSVEPSFEHQLNSHEGKADGKQRIDDLSYFLDSQRSIIPLVSSPSSSSSSLSSSSSSSPLLSSSSVGKNLLRNNNNNNNNLYDFYGTRGSSYVPADENENSLVDYVVDLPGKRKFIPLRGRKDELPFYSGTDSFDSPYDDGYRKKAAFTGMRGKKMDPSSSFNNRQALINRRVYGPIGNLPWISFANLNEAVGFKRSRPFAAMRGKRSIKSKSLLPF